MNFTITQAREDQTAIVSRILGEAATWLIERGEPMWPLSDTTPAALQAGVTAGLYYIAWREAVAIGAVRLQLEDALFWPDVPTGEAIFVHRLAVVRSAAGTGVSEALLAFAANRAKELGRKFVRLDCLADRASLKRVYETRGFRLHSERTVGGFHIARYERRL